jgi:hypothetical protein
VFRVPKLFILLFVCLSILTAFLIHWGHSYLGKGEFDLSSKEVPSPERVIEKVVEVTNRLNKGSRSVIPSEIKNCKCTVAVSDPQDFEFEDARQCSGLRQTYENSFRLASPIFRETRAKRSAEFPRACLLYAMKNSMGTGATKSNSLSTCKDAAGTPQRGGFKSCVTQTYVNTIYNYYSDVTDCLDVPQRDFIPKIFNESGFHPNALGAGLDAGIGQLTSIAIAEANKKFHHFRDSVVASAKISCQRLASQVKSMKPKASSPAARCGLMAAPENPLVNLFYMSVKYHQDREFIRQALAEHKIVDRLKAQGLPPSKYEMEQLYQILSTLGYNTGAGSAVIFLSNYLKRMEKRGQKITLADFDFRSKLKSRQTIKAKKPTELTFPEYMFLFQRVGTPGYGSIVRSYADRLNRVFKEGVCVPDSYLAL